MNSLSWLAQWLRIALTPGVGAVTYLKLLQGFGSPEGILAQSATSLSNAVGPRIAQALVAPSSPDRAQTELVVAQQLALLSEPNHYILSLDDPRYPSQLLALSAPPPLLWAVGNIALLERSCISIVGSRHATRNGLENARGFALTLSKANWCVVSGMALGIDGAAHEGALLGAASTIAVLGCGADTVYPARHQQLYQRIVEQGLVVSELPFGTPARAGQFPQRNRIIAALGQATVVVEAARESGSLITARLAGELGREVMAVPGSIHAPQSKGCHWLIRQGAALVESAQEILEVLGASAPALAHAGHAPGAPTTESWLLNQLGFDPTSFDALLQSSELEPSVLHQELLGLELANRIERLTDGRFQRIGR
jgi:DNA processing protein